MTVRMVLFGDQNLRAFEQALQQTGHQGA
jgi:hypothetical protein